MVWTSRVQLVVAFSLLSFFVLEATMRIANRIFDNRGFRLDAGDRGLIILVWTVMTLAMIAGSFWGKF
jgi:hypothetical protein